MGQQTNFSAEDPRWRAAGRRPARLLGGAAGLGVLVLVGCAQSGGGTGLLRAPEPGAQGLQTKGQVEFTWRSGADASSGSIEAGLPDGRRFTGTYVQPKTKEWRDSYNVYFGAWTGMWGAAGPWYAGPRSGFAVDYHGKALAHLEAADKTRMRCQFDLYEPNTGLAGGGQGDCQLSTNEDVFGAILRSDDERRD